MTRHGKSISGKMNMNKHENTSDFMYIQGTMDLPFALNKCFTWDSKTSRGEAPVPSILLQPLSFK